MVKKHNKELATFCLNVAGSDLSVVLNVLEKLIGKMLIIYSRNGRTKNILKKVTPKSLIFEKEEKISICRISKIEQIEIAKTKFRTY